MKSGTEIKLSTEVPEKATRRRLDAAHKLRILEEADRCASNGQVGELLRRERLYSSHLAMWRKQRQAGSLVALGPKKRGRKPNRRDPLTVKVERLERELRVAQERLRQAEAIIEVQKKYRCTWELSRAITRAKGAMDASGKRTEPTRRDCTNVHRTGDTTSIILSPSDRSTGADSACFANPKRIIESIVP